MVSDEKFFHYARSSLTQTARLLWGKISRTQPDIWLPLYIHLSDTAAIAELLWENWVPLSTKRIIARSIVDAGGVDDEQTGLIQAKRLFILCAIVHDIGKATPGFQTKGKYINLNIYNYIVNSGLHFPEISSPEKVTHALASQMIVERHRWSRNISIVLGGHHGTPPSKKQVMTIKHWPANTGFKDSAWIAVQDELYNFAISLVGIDRSDKLFELNINTAAQIIHTGFVIVADWLASNENYFHYMQIPVQVDKLESPSKRSATSWDDLGWSEPWVATNIPADDYYEKRFSITPHPSQKAILDNLTKVKIPGLVIIEAPMGEGKTEAAFAAAEILAHKTGSGGVIVTLPTQATSDGIFPRVLSWIELLESPGVHTIQLAHGKAQFNEDLQELLNRNQNHSQIGIDSEDSEQKAAAILNSWFYGSKKGMLADFVVGTIDQILMGGLKQKHLALRHLALANKVVIIDEVHAYDAYMSSYLDRILSWLGAYRVPTILLSATLPNNKRKHLVDSYLGTEPLENTNPVLPDWTSTRAYPLITYTDGSDVYQCMPERSSRSLHVEIAAINDLDIVSELNMLLEDGGCAGIITNTVARAHMLAQQCSAAFGEESVKLLHSRFVTPDRIKKERKLRKLLGPPPDNDSRPNKVIIIGTQVLEQSLDIDFDVVITDICPIDLLIQRIGRLHRHTGRLRPSYLEQARCYVMGILGDSNYERGTESIYRKYPLINTELLLEKEMNIPDDIAELVHQAYAEEGIETLSKDPETYRKAKQDFEQEIASKRIKASAYQIVGPDEGNETLVDWLNTDVQNDPYGKRGESTVRDSNDSIEVLVIQKNKEGKLIVLPWIDVYGGVELPTSSIPSDNVAKTVARCSVRLPSQLCMPWSIDKTILELEQMNIDSLPASWQESRWLVGDLFLILDSEYRTELGGLLLCYTQEDGLTIEGRADGN
jgi:CRISPR-associated endonuclease/helicase Cas3